MSNTTRIKITKADKIQKIKIRSIKHKKIEAKEKEHYED